jgi:hypothetical protein
VDPELEDGSRPHVTEPSHRTQSPGPGLQPVSPGIEADPELEPELEPESGCPVREPPQVIAARAAISARTTFVLRPSLRLTLLKIRRALVGRSMAKCVVDFGLVYKCSRLDGCREMKNASAAGWRTSWGTRNTLSGERESGRLVVIVEQQSDI